MNHSSLPFSHRSGSVTGLNPFKPNVFPCFKLYQSCFKVIYLTAMFLLVNIEKIKCIKLNRFYFMMFSCQGLRITTVLSVLFCWVVWFQSTAEVSEPWIRQASVKTNISPIHLIASNSRKTVHNFPESTMRREEKAAGSTRINQPVCLTIALFTVNPAHLHYNEI